MIRPLTFLAIFLLAIVFIWAFGFALGFILHSEFIDPEMELKYSMYEYSFNKPFPGYYLSGLMLFTPLFLILYIVMMLFKSKIVFQKYITIINIAIYFVYGILVFGGQFWHLADVFEGNFKGWLSGQHADKYFGISSLLGLLIYTALIKRHLKYGRQEVAT